MRVLITQSNYIPWKGYFDAIRAADFCVLYDEVQYTRRDWRNRNRIKTPAGLKWLSVPVSNDYARQRISEVKIDGQHWRRKHLESLRHSYGSLPFYDEVMEFLTPAYEAGDVYLSELNLSLIRAISRYLKIETAMRQSREFELVSGRSERLLHICKELGASEYLSGPSAAAYLDEDLFARQGIAVQYLDFSNYPQYPQLHGNFVHEVTILDLLFSKGHEALQFMKRL